MTCWRQNRGLGRCLGHDMSDWNTRMINLPDIRQTDRWDGGYAAVKTVLAYFGQPDPDRSRPPFTADDVEPEDIARVIRQYDLGVACGEMDLLDLKHNCSRGRPTICFVQLDDFSHFVVCRGVGRGKVYIQCPLRGRVSVADGEFLRQWWGLTRRSKHSQTGISVWERV